MKNNPHAFTLSTELNCHMAVLETTKIPVTGSLPMSLTSTFSSFPLYINFFFIKQ